jgi:hypothetical protein
MAAFIASYDLQETNPSPHAKFLEKARENGWNYWILAGGTEWHRLPNTTLVGNFPDMNAAVAALKKTRSDTEAALGRTVTMPKWIVSERAKSIVVSDERQPKK